MNPDVRRGILRVASKNVAFRQALARELRAYQNGQIQAAVGRIVDRASVPAVIDALAELCLKKADENEDSDTPDRVQIRAWNQLGSQLNVLARSARSNLSLK